MSWALTLASAFSSSLAASATLLHAAQCSGVEPFLSLALTLAFAFNSTLFELLKRFVFTGFSR